MYLIELDNRCLASNTAGRCEMNDIVCDSTSNQFNVCEENREKINVCKQATNRHRVVKTILWTEPKSRPRSRSSNFIQKTSEEENCMLY